MAFLLGLACGLGVPAKLREKVIAGAKLLLSKITQKKSS
jgi:hypothetical protein